MIEFNWRSVLWLMLIALCGIAFLSVVAYAEPSNVSIEGGSYVLVEYPSYGPPNAVYRLPEQGADVFLNDTVDISGQGWGTGVAWFGKYGEYDYPLYIRQFTGYKRDVQRFYIDPAIFSERPGMWYQYYGNETEKRGNLEAFNVVSMYINKTTMYPNGTLIATSEGAPHQVIEKPEPKEVVLPDYPVADYVIAQGDPLDTGFNKVWIFGRLDGIYDTSGSLSKEQVWGYLSQGSYKIVSHDPGKNLEWDVKYDNGVLKQKLGWEINTVDIRGLTPYLAMDKFNQLVAKTDDVVRTYSLEVQEPSISIVQINEVDVGNRIPVFYEPGMTLLDVRGYTNAANNTLLSFSIDYGAKDSKVYTTNAIETNPGNLRVYRVYIPINKNTMTNGMHTIKGWTAIGGEIYADFPVSELPADSFVPNATIKYIGDRNPWVAPVTVVVTQKETVVVTQTVTIPITPSPEQVEEAAQKIIDEQNWNIARLAVVVIFAAIGLAFLGWFGYSIWRAKKRREP